MKVSSRSDAPPARRPARTPRVAVVQDGARGHYGVPLALQQAGMLERVYTDWFIGRSSLRRAVAALLKRAYPALGQRMADRCCDLLDPGHVTQSTLLTLRQRLSPSRPRDRQAYFEWQAADTARWILGRGLGDANALFGFVRNLDPDLAAAAARQGLVTVGDQMIAPAAVELRETLLQLERFAGWEPGLDPGTLRRIDEYEQRTWAALTHLTAPSEYVRHGLIGEGIAPQKVSVVPYPVSGVFSFVDRAGRSGPVTVGFLGAVGLRKGVPYFFEVARRFAAPASRGRAVRFVMIGPVLLEPAIAAQHRGQVELIGAVPRSDVPRWLERLDVVLFPTTCEGSAYALMEAMASGLPVVTSPNSGTVARHGQEGFLAPYDDIDALSAHLERLIDDAALRLDMGRAARARYESFDLDAYARDLAALFHRLLP